MLIAFLLAAASLLPARGYARSSASKARLAQVGWIFHGVSVQAPHKRSAKGKVKEALFARYLLRTKSKQRASIRFKDKTTLHMNEETSLQLRSPHVTYVKNGEVDEALAPGTNHKVQTASAVASAIGTNFDVKSVHGGTIFLVVHGVIQVKNKKGTVTVKPNHESVVLKGQAPQPPKKVNVKKATSWTSGMPMPVLPENVALDAAGGKVVAFSSQYRSVNQQPFWDAKFLIDGRLDYGWESASGQVTNQWVKVQLAGGKTYNVSEVIIDPASTHDAPPVPAADLKDFEIRVSTTGTADADFTTVFTGTCQDTDTLQHFPLPAPVKAKYVELFARDNYGSPDWLAVAELEIAGTPA